MKIKNQMLDPLEILSPNANVDPNQRTSSWIAAKKFLSVAVFGFTSAERILIASICKLSQARLQQAGSKVGPKHFAGFQVSGHGHYLNPDILIIDGDDDEAKQLSLAVHSSNPSIARVVASRNPQQFSSRPGGFVVFDRKRLGRLLLQSLDQVVEHWSRNDRRNPTTSWTKSSGKVDRRRKLCLVVDDSWLVHTQMELLLQDYPLNTYFSKDAESALALVRRHSFSMIFLDIMLPEMNGYDACKLLKTNPKTNATPVVMLTSKTSRFDKMRGRIVGCDKYLTKPVNADDVRQVLQQYHIIA